MEIKRFFLKSLAFCTGVCTVLWILLVYTSISHLQIYPTPGENSWVGALIVLIAAAAAVMMFCIWLHGRRKFDDWRPVHSLIFAGICLLSVGLGLLFSYLIIHGIENLK